MPEFPDSEVKKIAESIILGSTDDIEYLTVAEVTSYILRDIEWPIIDNMDEEEAIWHRVDAMIKKAKVTITFE